MSFALSKGQKQTISDEFGPACALAGKDVETGRGERRGAERWVSEHPAGRACNDGRNWHTALGGYAHFTGGKDLGAQPRTLVYP